MSFRISAESHIDVDFGETAIENLFIKHFLPTADEDQIKVYLLGLYYAKHHPDVSISALAQELDISAQRVMEAFKYWENQHILTIERHDGEFGVAYLSLRSQIFAGTAPKNTALLSGKALAEMLLSVTGRTLSGAEYSYYENFMRATGGKTDILKTVLTLYYQDLKRNDFAEIRKYLDEILKTGMSDLEEITIEASHFFTRSTLYRTVKRMIGGKTDATPAEQSMINGWIDKYQMSADEILHFVETRSPNTNNPTVGFINKAIIEEKEKVAEDEQKLSLFKQLKFAITGSRYAVNQAERSMMAKWFDELGMTEAEILAEIEKYSATRRGASVAYLDERIRGIEPQKEQADRKAKKARKSSGKKAGEFVDEELEALIMKREAEHSNGSE